MHERFKYLTPESTSVDISLKGPICASFGSVSGNYSGNFGDEGLPGEDIFADDIIDGGTF